jgi:serine phosphatase RsbU (regulator of sigma subunit)
MQLGGDFYDAVQTDDGSIHLVVGDVSGHGADEAALGVSLRIAWRTLILAGMPPAHILPVLDKVLVSERHTPTLFTTVAAASVSPARDQLTVYLAGHPPPLLVDGTRARPVPDTALGLPLGVDRNAEWRSLDVPLTPGWALLLYTDGLIEARTAGGKPLWLDGVLDLLRPQLAASGTGWRADPNTLLNKLLDALEPHAGPTTSRSRCSPTPDERAGTRR